MKRNEKDIAEKKTRMAYEANRKLRGNWGAISPVTRAIPNKKKNAKENPKYGIKGDE